MRIAGRGVTVIRVPPVPGLGVEINPAGFRRFERLVVDRDCAARVALPGEINMARTGESCQRDQREERRQKARRDQ